MPGENFFVSPNVNDAILLFKINLNFVLLFEKDHRHIGTIVDRISTGINALIVYL